MSTGLIQDIERGPVTVAQSVSMSAPALEIAANDTVDVTDAKLPTRRLPLTLSAIRIGLKWLDIVIACAIAAYFLRAATGGILTATVSQILPFALIPIASAWGLRIASAYRLGLRRSIIDQVLATAYGSGLPLAGLGTNHALALSS